MREYEYEGGEESPRGGTDMNKRRLNYTLSLVAILSFLLVLGLSGCSTLTSGEKDFSGLKGDDSTPQICGEEEFALTAGQTIDVGTVRVSNDEDNLYVTYNTTDDWYLTGVKLYVRDSEPTERLNPGKAPYKSGDIFYARSHTFTVPLDEFEVTCDVTELWLQAHADVVRLDEEVPDSGETAYGGDITKPKKGSWYGNISYTVQCCEEEQEPCYKWESETAWADGTRYVTSGNWATYTIYEADKTVTLYAGQDMEAGTVYFSSPEDGDVTITITLNEGWRFAPVKENVKIQDYEIAPPAENPKPGQFAWKDTVDPSESSFSITVPENNFYGVHVDVEHWVEVECP